MQHQEADHDDKEKERDAVRRHFRTLVGFTEQPGDQHDESRLHEFRRLDIDAENDQPAPRALDLGAEMRRRRHQDDADDEHQQRHFADVVRRQERGREHHRDGGNEEEDLPVDEMERVEPDAGRDRTSRRVQTTRWRYRY